LDGRDFSLNVTELFLVSGTSMINMSLCNITIWRVIQYRTECMLNRLKETLHSYYQLDVINHTIIINI